MLRLAAEDLPFTGGGPVKSYSEGAYAAVACHDYPTVWDRAAPEATRRAQLAAGRALLAPNAYAPFPNDVWLDSLYINQYVTGCLEWPTPDPLDPPAPAGATYPSVPVLVLDGDLDVITPLGDSRRAASLFPNSQLVVVRNVGHVTALADFDRCASGIVRRFLTTLDAGDVSCAANASEIHVVPDFPRRLSAAPEASSAGPRDRSTALDRRAAWAASWTVGDALARWVLMYGAEGHGLRGGRFVASGDYYSFEPVQLRLRRARFVPDLGVSGELTWDRRELRVHGRLRLSGAHTGKLSISWPHSRHPRRRLDTRQARRPPGAAAHSRSLSVVSRVETERDDSPGADADQRPRGVDRLGLTPHLEHARPPGVDARKVVDHYGSAAGARDVAVLLGVDEVTAADVDRVVLGVVAKAHRHDVRRAVLADGRHPREPTLPVQVLELELAERAHQWFSPARTRPMIASMRRRAPARLTTE